MLIGEINLKVAIIGAGITGLACAHELERHNISPSIIERKSFIGDIETHVTASISVMNRPLPDWVDYVKDNYDINIEPLNVIKKISHYSPNKKAIVKGKLGYLFKRSYEPDAIMGQLYSQLNKSNLILSEYADYEVLKEQFDYVVIANGDSNYTKELGCWQQRVSGWIRGAVVLGSFDPTEVIMWIIKSYSNR